MFKGSVMPVWSLNNNIYSMTSLYTFFKFFFKFWCVPSISKIRKVTRARNYVGVDIGNSLGEKKIVFDGVQA